MGPLDWYLEPLLAFLQERIAEIAQDTEAYNHYVDDHLPKRQRTGSIPRKEMNRIVPWQRRVPKQLEKGLQMLRECIANEAIYKKIKDGEDPGPLPSFYREPLDTMSIRIYSKYFRVAHEVFDAQHEPWSERDKKDREQRRRKNAKLDDIGYYRRYQLGRHGEITDENDFDSVKAFEDMAFDHSGELGLSRMDVHATDCYTPGHWLITFGFSYSAYLEDAVDIAVALYETGCPLIIHDAQKILDVLEEKDNVLLSPHYFHDYFCHHDEGSVFPLPYECYLGDKDELTRKQYNEIVVLAEWEPEEPVVLDTLLPMDDPVYDLIRDEISEPLTLCGILTMLERKYDVVLGISNYSSHQHCHLFEHDYFIQQLTKDSSLERHDVAFLMNAKLINTVQFQSHIVNHEERIPYLLQLITDYYNWDWVDGTDMIWLLRTSSSALLTDQEKENIYSVFSKFSQLRILHAEGIDEELGNDVSLTVIVAK